MNTKSKLHKITIILAIILILFNFIIPTEIYALTISDEVITWIMEKYSSSIYSQNAAEDVANKIANVSGVNSISIKNGKLHIEYKGQWNTIKGNIEQALKETYLTQNDINIFFNSDRFESNGTETSEKSYEEMNEKEQFYYWIGSHFSVSTATIDMYWDNYQNGIEGTNGKKAVVVAKDANGNITNIELNLNQDVQAATGTSDEAATEINNYNNSNYWDKEAAVGLGLESLLIVPTVGLFTTAIDGIYKVFQNFVLGNFGNHIVVDVNDSTNGLILDGSQVDDGDKSIAIPIQKSELYHLPTMILTPGAIFEGKVAALNANFFDPDDASNELGGERMSTVSQLKSVVSSWYITLRNIAIVGLLSVLIYIGIRIVISSSNNDKAKYKQFFMDWLVALCLIFFMHYIMSFMMTITDSITSMLASSDSTSEYQAKEVLVQFEDSNNKSQPGNTYMYTSFAGVARMRLQYDGTATKLGYMVLYIAFVGYTVYFSFVYLKRILYLAFFTMIAPLVALTYPIDKMKDGKAQAFNFWFKEYVFYSLLQPLHLLLYTVFVSSAISLASKNMIYAIVAMAFIVPAEKIVKTMFGIKGQTENGIGGFVGASVATHMFSAMRQRQKPPKETMNHGGEKKPRISKDPNGTKEMDTFGIQDMQPALTSQSQNTTTNQNPNTDTNMANGMEGQQAEQFQQNSSTYSPQASTQNGSAGLTAPQNIPISTSPSEANNKEKRSIANNFKKAVGRRWTAAGGGKGVLLSAAKKGAKAYATGVGAVGLGAIGLGMGMVGGDLNNAWQGLAAGVGVGTYLGGNTGKKIVNAVSDTYNARNAVGSFASEVLHGQDESIRIHEERDYMNNRSNLDRIQAEHQDWKAEEIQEYAKREYNMMYNSKTSDVDLADKALELEDEYMKNGMSSEDAHKKAAGILNATKYYDASTFRSTKKLDEARGAMVGRLQEQGYSHDKAVADVNSHFRDIAKLHGVKNIPDMKASKQTTQNQPQKPTKQHK